MSMNPTLLQDAKIVSLATNLPGPLAASRLQRMGATLIKVEPPAGDPFAEIYPEWYRELAEGQRVIQLNLKDQQEKAELEDLLHESGVLIISMRTAALEPRFQERLKAVFGLRSLRRQNLEKVFLRRTAQECKAWAINSDVPFEVVRESDAVVEANKV